MLSAVMWRRVTWVLVPAAFVSVTMACRSEAPTSGAPEVPTKARTEFTERIENFFEYRPLVPGRPSDFLIHLTDLADGSPVAGADVTVVLRGEGDGQRHETKAKVGRVTGIYVAEVTVPAAGRYTVEFRVTNAKLDERMVLSDFATEDGR